MVAMYSTGKLSGMRQSLETIGITSILQRVEERNLKDKFARHKQLRNPEGSGTRLFQILPSQQTPKDGLIKLASLIEKCWIKDVT